MPENVLFKGQGIEITDSEVHIGRNSWCKENITSVSVEQKSMPTGQRSAAVVAGLLLCLIVAFLPRDAVSCGAPLAIIGLAFLFSGIVGTKSYALNLETLDGEVVAFTSANRGQVRKMEQVLEQHVIQVRQSKSGA